MRNESLSIGRFSGFIRQYVEDNVYNHIVNEVDAKSLWKKIETLYACSTRNNKIYLLNSLMNLRYKEEISISDHLNDFQGLRDQLSQMGIKFDVEVLGLCDGKGSSTNSVERPLTCQMESTTRVMVKRIQEDAFLHAINSSVE